ncbi:MAG TPA: sulfotransferase domain-containing protein [Verrucomicrobiae bacterium]|nr:sulfotransferase domain-containing protein [Verrucomicrobiae bacterium]
MNHILPEDIFIVAYPKSGITWFQNLLCGVVYGVNPAMSPPHLVNDLVPDLHYGKYYRRYNTPMYFKSHDRPRAEFRRVVYLLRDGRDVMVSFKHYVEAVGGIPLDFLQFVTQEESLFPCKWHRHVEEWVRNPFGAEMLIIKYEDLLDQPVLEMERFCDFVKVPRDRGHITAMVEASRFDRLRKKEDRFGSHRPVEWPSDKHFFRRGIVGSHKDEMPPNVLEAFLSDAAETLRRHGYPLGGSSFKVASEMAGM